jgi:hypothetical protein
MLETHLTWYRPAEARSPAYFPIWVLRKVWNTDGTCLQFLDLQARICDNKDMEYIQAMPSVVVYFRG